jgi:hypothetical protein
MPLPSNQREIPFGPIPRTAPRRSTRQIIDYNTIERREVLPHNPVSQAPLPIQLSKNAVPSKSHDTTKGGGQDTAMPDVQESEEEEPAQSTPTRTRSIPSLVTVRREKTIQRKPRKAREETTWTIHHYDITLLDDEWVNTSKKGLATVKNRLWTCKYCIDFTSTDKSRLGNSSNTNDHLKKAHRFSKADHKLGKRVTYGINKAQQCTIDEFTAVGVSLDPTEALLQYVVVTNQPFSICDETSFMALYTSHGSICPITNRFSLRNAIGARFQESRSELKAEMQRDCTSFSISFDGWSAGNHIHILGVIAHWITAAWERRSVTIEFSEMHGKSGATIAEMLYLSFGPDYEKSTEVVRENVRTITTEKHIGLNIAHKLFAVCGDNASPNDTFCDHFHQRLLSNGFDDNPASGNSLPLCRFHGRNSRIRCMAHIIALVVGAVLTFLQAGTYADAAVLLQAAEDNKGVFSSDCSALSVYQKIRTLVLYIMASDERRAAWHVICPVMIPLDVDTRWNSLFLMMASARANRGAFVLFVRQYLGATTILPSDEEWKVCEVMENVLQPFYDFTLQVSRDQPGLSESIGILWGLDDLLDDVSKADGQFGDVGPDIQLAFQAGVAKLDEYHQLCRENIMYYVAQVLDPRIKLANIREQCGDNADGIIKEVREWLKKEYPFTLPSLSQPPSQAECPPGYSQNQWKLLKRAMPTQPLNPVSDIDTYLNSDPISWDPFNEIYREVDWILTWWKSHATEFPLMAKAARDLLAVPGSEVDCERLFCGGKDMLGIRRLSLTGETIRWLTLLKSCFERKSNRGRAKLPTVRVIGVLCQISTNYTSFTAPTKPSKAQPTSLWPSCHIITLIAAATSLPSLQRPVFHRCSDQSSIAFCPSVASSQLFSFTSTSAAFSPIN